MLFVKGTLHVLDTSDNGPFIVETAPSVTFMVALNCPVHAGYTGMPPGVTATVPVSVGPVSVPLNVPFISTMPDDSTIETGPVIAVLFCERTHVKRASLPLTLTDPTHVPPI